jgi:hypothetical protein
MVLPVEFGFRHLHRIAHTPCTKQIFIHPKRPFPALHFPPARYVQLDYS